jgi:hypothetical protein
METKERVRGVARAFFDRTRARSPSDAEQQADQQVAPEQSCELFGQIGRPALDEAGRSRLGHDAAQRRTAGCAPERVEGLRHLRRLDRLRNRQPKDGNAFYQGNATGLSPGQLGAAYSIPTLFVPLLFITHILAFRLLLRHEQEPVMGKGRQPALGYRP